MFRYKPVYAALEIYLGRTRGISVKTYLEPLIDIEAVEPNHIGPALEEGTDYWGVKPRPASYGASSHEQMSAER